MEPSLASNWWVLALRGGLAIAFGAAVFFSPDMALVVTIALFAGYAFADGVLALWAAVSAPFESWTWWALALEGLVGVAVGVITLVWPELTGSILLYFIACRAVVIGVNEAAVAVRFGKEGAALLALAGVLSVLFGLTALFAPGVGLPTVAWLIGLYALTFGGLQLAVAVRLRNNHRVMPTGAGTIA